MPLLDVHVIRQLANDVGEEVLPTLLDAFLEETKLRLTHIQKLAATQNWIELGKEGHTLKSTAGSFGLMDLHLAAKALDEACRKGDHAAVLSLAQDVDSLGWQSVNTLEAWLANPS